MWVNEIIGEINSFVWGPVMLAFLIGTGIFLTFRLKFHPWRKLGYGLKLAFSKRGDTSKEPGDISPFAALMTSLAATLGTGNIAGVATAIAIGGPGAVFWMWVSAFFGMATKYAEAVLAVKFRVKDKNGNMCGGPMYALERGFKHKLIGRTLAVCFAAFAAIASFGIGNMTQANSVANALSASFDVPLWITGLLLSALTALVIIGGIKNIARVASKIVPVMAVFYIFCGLIVIVLNIDNLIPGFMNLIRSAFSGQAAVGGFAGAATMMALRYGLARGVFTNEAGLGSASIAAAAAKTDHPARQGLISMTGTFIDTFIVCTVTALAIASSGVWQTGETGAALTILAFESSLPGIGGYLVSIGLIFFAFSSILGWSYYGEKSLEYLFGERIAFYYRTLFCGVLIIGATIPLKTVWDFADTMNGLMAIPNLICLLVLSNVVARETNGFMNTLYIAEKNKG